MKVALIAAMADNRVIGIDNSMPWNLPADMAWFRQHTLNKPVVMGRKTFESLPIRPLPKRTNVIISRDANYTPRDLTGQPLTDVIVVTSIEAALEALDGHEEVMFIGGAMLYEQVLPRADTLYLTTVHQDFDGDAFFPEFDPKAWQCSFEEHHQADDRNPHDYSFLIYQRQA